MQTRNLALANAIHIRCLSILCDKVFTKEDWIDMGDAGMLGGAIEKVHLSYYILFFSLLTVKNELT